jgi:hypothetical protein
MTSLTLATFVNPASSATYLELQGNDGKSVDAYKVALKNLTDAMEATNLAGSSNTAHNDKAPTDGGDFNVTSFAANPDTPMEVPNQRTNPGLDSASGNIDISFPANPGSEPNYARYVASQDKYASTTNSISTISDVYK